MVYAGLHLHTSTVLKMESVYGSVGSSGWNQDSCTCSRDEVGASSRRREEGMVPPGLFAYGILCRNKYLSRFQLGLSKRNVNLRLQSVMGLIVMIY